MEGGRKSGLDALTPREVEILSLLKRGYSTRRISDQLSLSVGTVRNHISQMLKKTGARTRLELLVQSQSVGE